MNQVIAELMRDHGYTEQQIDAGGLRITTTVDKGYQDAAVASVNDVMERREDRRSCARRWSRSTPKTGGVLAYYGGASGTDNDYAQAHRQPGSSMKPYMLATALEQGISVTPAGTAARRRRSRTARPAGASTPATPRARPAR